MLNEYTSLHTHCIIPIEFASFQANKKYISMSMTMITIEINCNCNWLWLGRINKPVAISQKPPTYTRVHSTPRKPPMTHTVHCSPRNPPMYVHTCTRTFSVSFFFVPLESLLGSYVHPCTLYPMKASYVRTRMYKTVLSPFLFCTLRKPPRILCTQYKTVHYAVHGARSKTVQPQIQSDFQPPTPLPLTPPKFQV